MTISSYVSFNSRPLAADSYGALSKCPEPIKKEIFSYLAKSDLLQARNVSKGFGKLTNESEIWTSFLKNLPSIPQWTQERTHFSESSLLKLRNQSAWQKTLENHKLESTSVSINLKQASPASVHAIGNFALIAEQGGKFSVYDCQTGTSLREIEEFPTSSQESLHFKTCNSQLYFALYGSSFALRHLHNNQLLFKGNNLHPSQVVAYYDQKMVYLNVQGQLNIHNLQESKISTIECPALKAQQNLSFVQDKNHLVVWNEEGEISLFDLEKNSVKTLYTQQTSIERLKIVEGNKFIYLDKEQKSIYLNDLETGKLVHTFGFDTKQEFPASDLQSEDFLFETLDHTLVTFIRHPGKKTLCSWDMLTGNNLTEHQIRGYEINKLIVTPDAMIGWTAQNELIPYERKKESQSARALSFADYELQEIKGNLLYLKQKATKALILYNLESKKFVQTNISISPNEKISFQENKIFSQEKGSSILLSRQLTNPTPRPVVAPSTPTNSHFLEKAVKKIKDKAKNATKNLLKRNA